MNSIAARSGHLAGLNGMFVSYRKDGGSTGADVFVEWYHLYGRGVVFDVFSSKPLFGWKSNADSMARALKSFRATD